MREIEISSRKQVNEDSVSRGNADLHEKSGNASDGQHSRCPSVARRLLGGG